MQSWLSSANATNCNFPLQNLPYGIASYSGSAPRCVVAIGDQVVDLSVLEQCKLIQTGVEKQVFLNNSINAFMALGQRSWDAVRQSLTDLMVVNGDSRLRDDNALCQRALRPLREATLHRPFEVSEYTDFYAGRQHAFNVGSMFRGAQNALPPNWLHIPIGYNGRASTVVVSGTPLRRPLGQLKASDASTPSFGPSQRLDIELELGAVVGQSNVLGQPVTVAQADAMLFGYVLLNDWSARDIQAWEYQPLGPFQAKAFGTTISPWVVTCAALEPFRVSTPPRETPLLPYLHEPKPMLYDIELEIYMRSAVAAQRTRISKTNYRTHYFSAAQQLAHHAVSGCLMRTGDLLGSGTISGSSTEQYGSLLEMTWGGDRPIVLNSGESRTFVEDGDEVTLTGWAQGDGYRIGFGECTGVIEPSISFPE